jgi:hypothetical protein
MIKSQNIQDVILLWKDLTQLYIRAQKFKEADKLLNRYYDVVKLHFGPKSMEVVQAMKERAQLMFNTSDYD